MSFSTKATLDIIKKALTEKLELSEMAISKPNLDKTILILKRYFEKELKTKFYRFGGDHGYTEITHGLGVLFFYKFAGKTKAVRFNYIKNEIASVTLWDEFHGGQGDHTIQLNGLNAIQGAHKILDILKSKTIKNQEIRVFADPNLSEETLLEAKRIAPADFYDLVASNIPHGEKITAISWSALSDIAANNDNQIPSIVRSLKSGGKFPNYLYDLSSLKKGGQNDSGADTNDSNSKKLDYFIKITAQDTETKKFLSIKGDQRAADLLNQIQGAIDNPNEKVLARNPDSLFGIMRNLVQLVCRGSRNALVIYGGPGTGKTFTVTETLKQEGLIKNKDWYVIKGKITTSALYQTLFMHRKDSILLFDDTDSIWGDSEAANILKAALDSYDERSISWVSPRNLNVSRMTDDEKEDYNNRVDKYIDSIGQDSSGGDGDDDKKQKPMKLPSEFVYTGKIIFISNLSYGQFDSAVLNRSAKIDMTLTDDEMFARIKSILPDVGDKDIPIDAKEEILHFLISRNKAGKLDNPSMRTYVAAEDLYKSGLDNWKDLLEYV